jgi:hypothetical protein
MYSKLNGRPLRTFTWTSQQLERADHYTRTGQMRIVCQLQEDSEDHYVCLVDCDDRTHVLLHFI